MKVEFGWEDGQCAQVIELVCDCGHDEGKEDELIVSHDETWNCPKCDRSIIFKWIGMTYKYQMAK